MKKGDKVKIKEDLVADKTYNGITFAYLMKEYKGKEAVVDSVSKEVENNDGHPTTIYSLDIDNGAWSWSEDMLEVVEESKEDEVEEHPLNYDGSDISTSEYPKEMDVWDEDSEEWERVNIIAYCPQLDYPFLTEMGRIDEYFGYKKAKDIDKAELDAIALLKKKGYTVTKN